MNHICFIDRNRKCRMPPMFESGANGRKFTHIYAEEETPESFIDKTQGVDLFLAISEIPFKIDNILTHLTLKRIPKAILFYDEPMSIISFFGNNHPFISQSVRKENNIHYFVWDNYWRKRLAEIGIKSFSTHLAADTAYFHPQQDPLIPHLKDHVVFVGNIPSFDSVYNPIATMEGKIGDVAQKLINRIEWSKYGENPFEIMKQVFKEEKFDHSFSDKLWRMFNRTAWLVGKRATRIKALNEVAKVAPLAIMSNLRLSGTAGFEELKHYGELSKATMIDTSPITYDQIGSLCRCGAVQFQTTDPQSVEGGIPYRVFQCAATASPLISDYKEQLTDCFDVGSEIMLYTKLDEIPKLIEHSLKNRQQTRQIGLNSHKRFIQQHTWTHRIEDIISKINQHALSPATAE